MFTRSAAAGPSFDDLAFGPALDRGRLDGWLAAAWQHAHALADAFRDQADALRDACRAVPSPEVTVTFGGHFKSGKSSLLNGLLGRPLLPVDDLPETGALCHLGRGDRDRAVVVANDGRRTDLPCDTASIRRVVSLVGDTGDYNPAVAGVERLELTLAGCSVPPTARWIDSPGINDTEAMADRARAGAERADVLVWVLASRQPLAECEVDFLAPWVAARGPASLVFVLNCFLREDSAEQWQAFQQRDLPAIQTRLRDQAARLGYGPGDRPAMAAASGRAMARSMDFGGSTARALLEALSSAGNPRVIRSRVARVAAALGRAADRVEAAAAPARRKLEEDRRHRAEAVAAAEASKQAFARDAESAFRDFQTAWAKAARQAGDEVAGTVSSAGVSRDGSYSTSLNAKLKEASKKAVESFVSALDAAARKRGLSASGAAEREAIEKALTPKSRWVSVPTTKPDYTAAIAAGAACAALSVLTVWLLAPAGVAAGLALKAKAENEAAAKDAEGARADARAEGRLAAEEFDAKQAEVCALATAGRWSALPGEPDAGPAERLEALARHTREMAEGGWKIARGG